MGRKPRGSYPSDYFALLVHADVVFALLSFNSDVAPEGFRLDNEESCTTKEKEHSVNSKSFQSHALRILIPYLVCFSHLW